MEPIMPRHNGTTRRTATRAQSSKTARTARVAVDLGVTTPDGYAPVYGPSTPVYGATGTDGYAPDGATRPDVAVYGPRSVGPVPTYPRTVRGPHTGTYGPVAATRADVA